MAKNFKKKDELDASELSGDGFEIGTEGEGLQTPAQSAPQVTQGVGPRVYKGTQEIDHDLFKLEVARMVKNVSWTDIPDYEKVEHCHFFHSVDSSGKKQFTSTSVGGHFHEVTITATKSGVPHIEISPPKRWVIKKIRGMRKRVSEALLDAEGAVFDDHVHETTYLGSERIKIREANMEYAKLEAAMKAKQEPKVEGVLAR